MKNVVIRSSAFILSLLASTACGGAAGMSASGDPMEMGISNANTPSNSPTKSIDPTSTPPMAAGITGTWLFTNQRGTFTLVLAESGSGSFNGSTFTWKFDQNVLSLIGQQTINYNAMLAGDALTLSGGDLTSAITFHRQGSSAQTGGNPPPQVTGPMGQVAGVYYAEEASLDPMYYLSYTQYVYLYPNGTVSYSKSEGQATRTQISDSIEHFSSSSQSSGAGGNNGRWETDGTTITVYWSLWNNLVSTGNVDLAGQNITLSKMGVLEEGATLTFKRAQ